MNQITNLLPRITLIHSPSKRRSSLIAWTALWGMALLGASNLPAADVNSNLIGHWKLDESSGTNAADASGNGNHGTLNGGQSFDNDSVVGVIGNGLRFDGIDDFVNCGDIAAIDNQTQVTIAFWGRRAALKAYVNVGKRSAAGAMIVNIWSDGVVYFNVSKSGNIWGRVAQNDTNWHHYALVYDGTQTGNANRLKGYIDGVAQTLAFTGTVPSSSADSGDFTIGRDPGSGARSNGLIDSVRLYTRALTPGEIGALSALNAPTDITLSNSSVDENETIGTAVGTLSTVDADSGDAFNYTLTDSAGGRFQILGDQIQVANGSLLNREAASSHTLSVQVTDSGGNSLSKSLTITVDPIDEFDPTDLLLSGSSVSETSVSGTLIGHISHDDADQGETYQITLTDDAGGRFQIVGTQLQVANASLIDSETAASHSISVQIIDDGGAGQSYTESFSITVTPVDEFDPTDLTLSSDLVKRLSPTGTLVATISNNDADAETYVYALTDDAGGRFQISGDQLQVANGTLLISGTQHSITIQVTDDGGAGQSYSENFTIRVVENVPPVAVADGYGVNQDTTLTVPAAQGVLANDSDADGDPLRVSLVKGPDHGTLTLNADGSFTYVPNSGFFGKDSAVYQVNDGESDSNPAHVSLTVIESGSLFSINGSGTTQTGGTTVNGPTVSVLPGEGVTLSPNVTGGSGDYSFNWSGPFGGNGASVNSTNTFEVFPSQPGLNVFTVTVTDNLTGETLTSTVTVWVADVLDARELSVRRGSVQYSAHSASSFAKPKDTFRMTILGLDLSPGDRLSFSLNGAPVGDLNAGSGLTLDAKGKARGQLGTEQGNRFNDCRVKYNARKRTLRVRAGKGKFSNGPPVMRDSTGLTQAAMVKVFIDRAPVDGFIDEAVVLPLPFLVRVRKGNNGIIVEKGKLISGP